jgi:phage tail tape-measure protein
LRCTHGGAATATRGAHALVAARRRRVVVERVVVERVVVERVGEGCASALDVYTALSAQETKLHEDREQ